MHSRRFRISVDLPALSEVFCRLESASILGGNIARAEAGRFSYWAAEPREVFEFRSGQERPFEKLREALGGLHRGSGRTHGRELHNVFLGNGEHDASPIGARRDFGIHRVGVYEDAAGFHSVDRQRQAVSFRDRYGGAFGKG